MGCWGGGALENAVDVRVFGKAILDLQGIMKLRVSNNWRSHELLDYYNYDFVRRGLSLIGIRTDE